MTHDQFKKAADYWKNKKQNAMPEEKMKKTAIVTGSSRGIGFAIARQLGLDRANLVRLARRLDLPLSRPPRPPSR